MSSQRAPKPVRSYHLIALALLLAFFVQCACSSLRFRLPSLKRIRTFCGVALLNHIPLDARCLLADCPVAFGDGYYLSSAAESGSADQFWLDQHRWFVRAPFLLAGLCLGVSLWYVARKLYGTAAGHIVLALYAFSPGIVACSSLAGPQIFAAWGAFGLIFTAIATAHTLYAPREVILWNWKRIALLGISITFAAGAQWPLAWLLLPAAAFTQRLVRGTAPAWSPDGRQIAYVGTDQMLRIVPAGGGRARALGVPARSVDWQPLPRHSNRGCALATGSHALVARTEGVLSERNVVSNGYASPAWFGCLRGIGAERQLLMRYSQGGEASTYVNGALMEGRFALLSTSSGDEYGDCSNDVTRYDVATGVATSLFDQPFGCEAGPGVDSIALDSSGFAAWRATEPQPRYQPLTGISCPTISFCAAVDANGSVGTSTDPTGGRPAWSFADVNAPGGLGSVSCPSISLCVATAGSGGRVLTSTDPTGGASNWAPAQVDNDQLLLFASYVSCPSVSLCVIADDHGSVVTSTQPTGGPPAWTTAHVDSNTPGAFLGVSCPSASLCVALDETGNVAASTDPTGGASTWSLAHIGTSETIPPDGGVSCPSTSLCVAADGTGNIATSTDPAGGSSAWSLTKLPSGRPGAISCPSSSLCVAVDGAGNVISSTNPTGGAFAWQVANVDGSTRITSISCPTATRCVATDARGNVLTSDDPAGGASAWSVAAVDVPDCAAAGTACVAETLYARDDHGTRVIDSAPPGNGNSLVNVQMFGNNPFLYWTHDGQQRVAGLG